MNPNAVKSILPFNIHPLITSRIRRKAYAIRQSKSYENDSDENEKREK